MLGKTKKNVKEVMTSSSFKTDSSDEELM